MSISVRFFASLRENLGLEQLTLAPPTPLSVAEVWQLATANAEYPSGTLAAVNMTYADLEHAVTSGDEVAFFPPVTGG